MRSMTHGGNRTEWGGHSIAGAVVAEDVLRRRRWGADIDGFRYLKLANRLKHRSRVTPTPEAAKQDISHPDGMLRKVPEGNGRLMSESEKRELLRTPTGKQGSKLHLIRGRTKQTYRVTHPTQLNSVRVRNSSR